MLIGILSCKGEGSFITVDDNDFLSISSSDKVYILDTDDFILQSISCDKLTDLVLNNKLVVYNLYPCGEDSSYLANYEYIFTLGDLLDDIADIDNTIILKHTSDTFFGNMLYINNKSIDLDINMSKRFGENFNEDDSDFEYYCQLTLDKKVIADINLEQFDLENFKGSDSLNMSLGIHRFFSLDIGLVYKLSKEFIGVVIHFYSNDLDVYCSCTVIFDYEGNFIDIVCNDIDEVFIRNKDIKASSFVAKYITLGKEFFQLC